MKWFSVHLLILYSTLEFLTHLTQRFEFAALPLDVRKGSAFPINCHLSFEATPHALAAITRRSLVILRNLTERQSLSAHRAAQPLI